MPYTVCRVVTKPEVNTRFDPGISEICHSAMAIHVPIEASTWGKLIPTLAVYAILFYFLPPNLFYPTLGPKHVGG